MIPDPKHPNASSTAIVLDILSKKPRLTVKDLYDFFCERYEPGMSLQGFYNLIKKLAANRVLVKEGKLVSIDGSWIYNLLNFTNVLQQNYFGTNAAAATILLDEGESKTFTLDSVIGMDNFWWHALIIVIFYYATEEHKDKNAYVYVHHSWFQLIRTSSEQALNDAYSQHNMRLYHVDGSLSFLDSLTPQLIAGKNVDARHEIINEFGPNYYVVVIGDFIFETKLPVHIYDRMEEIYTSVTKMTQFDSSKILNLVIEPARTNLTISRDKKRAKKIRKRIQTVFAR